MLRHYTMIGQPKLNFIPLFAKHTDFNIYFQQYDRNDYICSLVVRGCRMISRIIEFNIQIPTSKFRLPTSESPDGEIGKRCGLRSR